MDLAHKAVLLTGGKRIGATVADALARRGADVALVYRASEHEAAATAQAIRDHGSRAVTIRADLARVDDCRRAVHETVRAFGRLDVLIAMASLYRQSRLDELSAEEWDTQLNVDLRSAFLCAQAAIAPMRAAGGGRIILFSDWVAGSGRPRYRGYVPYYVAKAGVIALAEALALELAPDGILVNVIAPGPIAPPPDISDAERAEVARATPVGRWGGDDEIVRAVLFLIESEFVTGETVRVDGGRHLL